MIAILGLIGVAISALVVMDADSYEDDVSIDSEADSRAAQTAPLTKVAVSEIVFADEIAGMMDDYSAKAAADLRVAHANEGSTNSGDFDDTPIANGGNALFQESHDNVVLAGDQGDRDLRDIVNGGADLTGLTNNIRPCDAVDDTFPMFEVAGQYVENFSTETDQIEVVYEGLTPPVLTTMLMQDGLALLADGQVVTTFADLSTLDLGCVTFVAA